MHMLRTVDKGRILKAEEEDAAGRQKDTMDKSKQESLLVMPMSVLMLRDKPSWS
jgi:hypothetical protein